MRGAISLFKKMKLGGGLFQLTPCLTNAYWRQGRNLYASNEIENKIDVDAPAKLINSSLLRFNSINSNRIDMDVPVYGTGEIVDIEFKVKIDAGTPCMIYSEVLFGGTTQHFRINILANGNPRVFLRNDQNVSLINNVTDTSITNVNDGDWHTLRWVDNAGNCQLLIGGVLSATDFNYTPSGTFTFNTNTLGALYFGASYIEPIDGNFAHYKRVGVEAQEMYFSEAEGAYVYDSGQNKPWLMGGTATRELQNEIHNNFEKGFSRVLRGNVTGYIETDYTPKKTTRYETTIIITPYTIDSTFYGNFDYDIAGIATFSCSRTEAGKVKFFRGDTYIDDIVVNDYDVLTIIHSQTELNINGVDYASILDSFDYLNPLTLLARQNVTAGIPIKAAIATDEILYAMKIYEGVALVRHYVAYDGGVKDLVNGTVIAETNALYHPYLTANDAGLDVFGQEPQNPQDGKTINYAENDIDFTNEGRNYIVNDSTIDEVVIIAGQSLAAGYNNNEAIEEYLKSPNANCKIIGYNPASVRSEISTWETLDETNNLAEIFGLEHMLAYQFGNRKVYFIKVAQGGTDINQDWGDGDTLRTKLIEKIGYAKTTLNNPRFSFYWGQWQKSTSIADSYNNYESYYNNLLAAIEAEIGASVHMQTLEKVNVSSSLYTTFNAECIILEAAQASIVANQSAILIDYSDQTLWDGIHTNNSGYNAIGERAFKLGIRPFISSYVIPDTLNEVNAYELEALIDNALKFANIETGVSIDKSVFYSIAPTGDCLTKTLKYIALWALMFNFAIQNNTINYLIYF